MATKKRCHRCGRFGHYQKTCKQTKDAQGRPIRQVRTVQNPSASDQTLAPDTAQAIGASETEVTQPDDKAVSGTIGEALGAEEFAAALDGSNTNDDINAEVYQGEVVSEREPAAKQEPSGPTVGELAFKKSVDMALSIWGEALNASVKAEIAPSPEIRELCSQAWTDCAKALGWLEHANDPRVALILAIGATGGTYGVATYQVIQVKRAERARKQ